VKTDTLQRLHTCVNLSELLEAKHDGIDPTLRDDRVRLFPVNSLVIFYSTQSIVVVRYLAKHQRVELPLVSNIVSRLRSQPTSRLPFLK